MNKQSVTAPPCAATHALIIAANSNTENFKILWEHDNVSILHKKDGFSIDLVDYDELKKEKLETALISISTPDKKIWKGSIQDFQAIFTIVNNTLYGLNQETMYGVRLQATISELTAVLSHYQADPQKDFFDSFK